MKTHMKVPRTFPWAIPWCHLATAFFPWMIICSMPHSWWRALGVPNIQFSSFLWHSLLVVLVYSVHHFENTISWRFLGNHVYCYILNALLSPTLFIFKVYINILWPQCWPATAFYNLYMNISVHGCTKLVTSSTNMSLRFWFFLKSYCNPAVHSLLCLNTCNPPLFFLPNVCLVPLFVWCSNEIHDFSLFLFIVRSCTSLAWFKVFISVWSWIPFFLQQ